MEESVGYPPKAGGTAKRFDLSAGWRSRLAIGTTGGLAFLTISGLLTWLGPFCRLAAEYQRLARTRAGAHTRAGM